MPHSGMLSLQTGRLVSTRYYRASSFQECVTAVLSPVISSERPGLASSEPAADRTPRYAQNWKQLSGLTVALFLSVLLSPILICIVFAFPSIVLYQQVFYLLHFETILE